MEGEEDDDDVIAESWETVVKYYLARDLDRGEQRAVEARVLRDARFASEWGDQIAARMEARVRRRERRRGGKG